MHCPGRVSCDLGVGGLRLVGDWVEGGKWRGWELILGWGSKESAGSLEGNAVGRTPGEGLRKMRRSVVVTKKRKKRKKKMKKKTKNKDKKRANKKK